MGRRKVVETKTDRKESLEELDDGRRNVFGSGGFVGVHSRGCVLDLGIWVRLHKFRVKQPITPAPGYLFRIRHLRGREDDGSVGSTK